MNAGTLATGCQKVRNVDQQNRLAGPDRGIDTFLEKKACSFP